MERLAELVSKLKEQFDNGSDSSKLLATTLLIERELMKMESAQPSAAVSSKVSVVMPAARNGYPQPVIAVVKDEQEVTAEELAVKEEEEASPKKEVKLEEAPPADNAPEFNFDPVIEIPTLSQQHTAKEINEILAIRDSSLNDKLKENKVEVGHILKDHPIRDLKKAIGINDRYVFINELFRGDEVMYERSLKTINAFRIYAEAEYWIERELKVKLGWEEDRETTKHFYQLIKRRFS